MGRLRLLARPDRGFCFLALNGTGHRAIRIGGNNSNRPKGDMIVHSFRTSEPVYAIFRVPPHSGSSRIVVRSPQVRFYDVDL